MTPWIEKKLAIWAMTPRGAQLAVQVQRNWPCADLYLSARLDAQAVHHSFSNIATALTEVFSQYDGHYFIMATGIVVRVIAKLIRDKTIDPAIVAGDEAGRFVISLVSGHLGGANELAHQLAIDIDAQPVITTATDVNDVPGIDVIAKHQGLYIENRQAVSQVSMAYLEGQALPLHDPGNYVQSHLSPEWIQPADMFAEDRSGVYVDYRIQPAPHRVLILRPKCLVAGMGCRRGVPKAELESFLDTVFNTHGLSIHSLAKIVSVDIKSNEPGLNQLAEALGVPISFYSTDALGRVTHMPNPSDRVNKHIGVKSVCEAAAMLATGQRHLIVTKQTCKTATLAIAAMPCSS